MMTTETRPMDAKDVAEYLQQNPRFFEDYADVVAEIFVPHPHGGHAIPIAERQIVTLREKNAEQEQRMRALGCVDVRVPGWEVRGCTPVGVEPSGWAAAKQVYR